MIGLAIDITQLHGEIKLFHREEWGEGKNFLLYILFKIFCPRRIFGEDMKSAATARIINIWCLCKQSMSSTGSHPWRHTRASASIDPESLQYCYCYEIHVIHSLLFSVLIPSSEGYRPFHFLWAILDPRPSTKNWADWSSHKPSQTSSHSPSRSRNRFSREGLLVSKRFGELTQPRVRLTPNFVFDNLPICARTKLKRTFFLSARARTKGVTIHMYTYIQILNK